MTHSGSLPLAKYHRASSVGSGTFGSVLTVYNDNGEEYAIKIFAKEDDEPIDLGALREISCLRLLREGNTHSNIIAMVDVQSSILDEDEEAGAGTDGLGMVLPLFPDGSVAGALTDERFKGLSRREKVKFAQELLSAVATLHDNGILHRDIKSDNVLLKVDENGSYHPVLIDFSLAKPVNATMFDIWTIPGNRKGKVDGTLAWNRDFQAFRHTGEVGTVTYTAPEVFQEEEPIYGTPMDLWSVGVVLLEVWCDQLLAAQKNSHALKMIESHLTNLPEDKPFPILLRNLLRIDPSLRWSARQALRSDAFAKLGLAEPPVRRMNVASALPVDSAEDDEGDSSAPSKAAQRKTLNRRRLVEKLCNELGGAEHPMTIPAALDYAVQMEQLDDELDDLSQSTSLLDCVVLSFRFWERELLDLEGLRDIDTGYFAQWNLADYLDNESTLFLMLDYCLYPRCLRL